MHYYALWGKGENNAMEIYLDNCATTKVCEAAVVAAADDAVAAAMAWTPLA